MDSKESPWDDDPHISKPNSTDGNVQEYLSYLSTVTDYFSVPLCAVAIAADIMLLVIVLKYKGLRTRTNFYLMHFAIAHMGYIVSTPLFYIILDTFYEGSFERNWYCVWIRIENYAMCLVLSFIGGFGVDSFLEKVRPSWFSKYNKRFNYVFSSFYFGHFLMYLIAAGICLKHGFSNNFNFYFVSANFFIILICVLCITHEERKMVKNLKLSTPHKTYALTISIIVLLLWMPLIVFYNLMILFKDVEAVEFALWYIAFFPEYLAYCCSIVVVCKLWTSNKLFKTAFRKVFRRSVSVADVDELNAAYSEQTATSPCET